MMAPTGLILKVIGSNIAMAAAGPMPGQYTHEGSDQHAGETQEEI